METKICTKCKKEKTIDNFYYRKKRNCYESCCKVCQYKMQKKYIEKNREKINILARENYKRHKEKYKIKVRKYKKENVEKIKEYHKKWYGLNKDKINKKAKEKRDNDNNFKLKGQVRHLLNMCFKRKGYKKGTKTEKILCCNYNDFIKYILKSYKTNYGYEWDGKEKVHIDHIIPLSTAKTEEDIIKLCHYTNLQLLKAEDNYKKSDNLKWQIERRF